MFLVVPCQLRSHADQARSKARTEQACARNNGQGKKRHVLFFQTNRGFKPKLGKQSNVLEPQGWREPQNASGRMLVGQRKTKGGQGGKKRVGNGSSLTYFLLRDSCTTHSTLSHRQLPQGAPSTTSQRTLRARHDTQALAARLLVILAGVEDSELTDKRFLGGVGLFWRLVFVGLMVAMGGLEASGLAVAGASIGGAGLIAMGVGCCDAMVFVFVGARDVHGSRCREPR